MGVNGITPFSQTPMRAIDCIRSLLPVNLKDRLAWQTDPVIPENEMTTKNDERAARLLHLNASGLEKGDPVATPLVQSSMFHLPGDPEGVRQYGRYDNPTWEAAEDALGLLEDAPALLFPSGMAAIAASLFSQLKAGDKIVLPSDGYYTTRLLAEDYLSRFGVSVETCPTNRMATTPLDGYSLIFIETPSNPGLDVVDIAVIGQRAHNAGAIVVADNTTMTPLGQRPLDLGADIVVSADTKAMNGHSDVLAGHVASRNTDAIEAMSHWRKLSGSIIGPHDAWLLHRGLATLDVRFDRMCATAEAISEKLAAHPAVREIRYPGLPDDPSHEISKRQMQRYGFLISLTLNSEDAAEAFINSCPYIQPATSFGGVHTSAERRARWGDAVDPGSIRLSIGCEPEQEIWKAIETTLNSVTAG